MTNPRAFLPDITLTSHFAGGDADLSQYVRDASFSVSRGSTSPSMSGLIADAGQFQATLTNTARQFDPSFTTGPHFGDLLPGVAMDLVATWAGNDYAVFVGVNTQWPQIYPNQRADQVTQIQCADAIRGLSRSQFTKILPRRLSGQRIVGILDAINYLGTFSVEDGTAYVPFFGDGLSSSAAWSLMSDACSAEWGALFVDVVGNVIFLDRAAIASVSIWNTPQAIFGDQAGELRFNDVLIAADDERIVNDADLLYNSFGSKAHAEDLTSQAKYRGTGSGVYSWQQNFQLSSGALARSYAHEVVRRFADAGDGVRIEKLVIKPAADPANLWPVVLGMELGTMITVKVTPQGGGARIVQDCFIRHIQHDYSSGSWVTTYDVDNTPLSTVTAFFDDGVTKFDDGTMYSF